MTNYLTRGKVGLISCTERPQLRYADLSGLLAAVAREEVCRISQGWTWVASLSKPIWVITARPWLTQEVIYTPGPSRSKSVSFAGILAIPLPFALSSCWACQFSGRTIIGLLIEDIFLFSSPSWPGTGIVVREDERLVVYYLCAVSGFVASTLRSLRCGFPSLICTSGMSWSAYTPVAIFPLTAEAALKKRHLDQPPYPHFQDGLEKSPPSPDPGPQYLLPFWVYFGVSQGAYRRIATAHLQALVRRY